MNFPTYSTSNLVQSNAPAGSSHKKDQICVLPHYEVTSQSAYACGERGGLFLVFSSLVILSHFPKIGNRGQFSELKIGQIWLSTEVIETTSCIIVLRLFSSWGRYRDFRFSENRANGLNFHPSVYVQWDDVPRRWTDTFIWFFFDQDGQAATNITNYQKLNRRYQD